MQRPFGRTRAIGALAGALTMVPRWIAAGPRWRRKRAYERRFLARIARGFVGRVALSGATPGAAAPGGVEPGGAGTLFVANHISWLDIPVLAGVIDAEFIAKDDVRGWPLVGPLARRTGTLFVSRERRSEARAQADSIGDRLRAGGSLILFAEGTTSDGTGVLPFRSSLFASSASAGRIQPVVIGYRRRDGAPFGDAEMAAIGWVGDEALAPNAARLARAAMIAEVVMLDPIEPGEGESRRDLAARCQRAVAEAYAALRATKRSA